MAEIEKNRLQSQDTHFKGQKRSISEGEPSWLDNLIKENISTGELISLIINTIKADSDYYKNVDKIYSHVSKIMALFYKKLNVKIFLFGSSVTNLALEDSDVDIYLDFQGHLPEPVEKFALTLRNKMRKSGYFNHVIYIPARVPIVTCVHRESQISCDVSFSNSFGVPNSRLIMLLLNIDDRIKPFILILKYFMKNHGVIAKNGFSSFTCTLLFVFFLQVLEDPLIPSIDYIQSLARSRTMFGGWDVSFIKDINYLTKNQLSIVEMLQKFFEFFSVFEFGFYVISCFTGKSYLKPLFSSLDLLPKEFHLYKENITKHKFEEFDYNRIMCLQGLFNHNFNITKNVSKKVIVDFQHICWKYASIGKELLGENRTTENERLYLIKLLDKNKESKKILKNNSVILFVGKKIIFDNCSYTEDNLRNEWSEYVFNSIRDILCRVMKCTIDLPPKNSEDDFFMSSANNEKVIHCEMHYHEIISKKRNEAKKEFKFPQNMSVINKEEIISNYLCDTVLKDAKKISLKFDIICTVEKRPTSFCMDLKPKKFQKYENNLVQQIFNFIQKNFPQWIE